MSDERIIIQDGPLSGSAFVIDGQVTIGRSPENTIQLDDLQVSRQHAMVQQTPAGTVIRDLNSGNGTFVGNRRIEEYRLNTGDVVRIGPVSLVYEGMDEAPPMSGTVAGEDSTVSASSGVQFDADDTAPVESTPADTIYQTLFAGEEGDSGGQLKNLQDRLRGIYEANQVIASENDLSKVFENILDQVFNLVPAHNGVILIKDERSGKLEAARKKTGAATDEIKVSTSIVNQALEKNEGIITFNAAGDDRFNPMSGGSIIMQNIASAMCAPLKYRAEILGVVYVDTRGTTHAFNHSDLELLVALAGPAAIAIKNAQYVRKIEEAYHDTLIALANAIELRDHYTVGHTWRVTNFALETAKSLEWDAEKLNECEMGGVLHDIGKIAIDDSILRKPDRLTDEEFGKMKIHPERGARMMQDIEFLVPLIPYALYHHERFDGKGYPFGLAGEDIPLEGRLLAVADTFDAMTSNRPYRKGLPVEVAIEELEKGRGTQFDPDMVDAFLKAWNEGRIQRILQDYHKDEESIACPFCSTYIKISDDTEAGDEIECGVCHRRLHVRKQNDVFYGELLASTKSGAHPHLSDHEEAAK